MKNYPPYFKAWELECPCGKCNGRMNNAFMEKLSAMREAAGFGFILSSAYRCPTHNAKVSRTGRTGPHTTGRAVDVACFGARADWIIDHFKDFGMTGRGINQKGDYNQRFIHVDDLDNSLTHPRPWSWSY